MSAVLKFPRARESAFHLWPAGRDIWQVIGPGDCCGGLFANADAAQRFVRAEAKVRGLAPTILYSPPVADADAARRRPPVAIVSRTDREAGRALSDIYLFARRPASNSNGGRR